MGNHKSRMASAFKKLSKKKISKADEHSSESDDSQASDNFEDKQLKQENVSTTAHLEQESEEDEATEHDKKVEAGD